MGKVHDEKSEQETNFNKKADSSENPPIYDMPPVNGSNTNGVVPVLSQPTATYVQVQPLVTSVQVASTAPDYTSTCECDKIWCSYCWLK